jgi:hypothetical protein
MENETQLTSDNTLNRRYWRGLYLQTLRKAKSPMGVPSAPKIQNGT